MDVGEVPENMKVDDHRSALGSRQHKASCSVDGIAYSDAHDDSLGKSTHFLTQNRRRHTRPLVQMELVCVGTVQGVGDLAISSHVWIGSRNLQHKLAGGRVFHHRLHVHKLEQEDNNNDQASICIMRLSDRISAG